MLTADGNAHTELDVNAHMYNWMCNAYFDWEVVCANVDS